MLALVSVSRLDSSLLIIFISLSIALRVQQPPINDDALQQQSSISISSALSLCHHVVLFRLVSTLGTTRRLCRCLQRSNRLDRRGRHVVKIEYRMRQYACAMIDREIERNERAGGNN